MIKSKQKAGAKKLFGRRVNWIYILLLIFFGVQFFIVRQAPVEITWNNFEEKMLQDGDVEHIEIINKERAEVFLNKEKITAEKYPDLSQSSRGPQYYFTIGSVETFENKLKVVQEKYQLETSPEIKYISRTNWFTTILSWVLPLIVIVAIWYYILSLSGRTGGRMGPGGSPFDFGKSKPTLFDQNQKSKISFENIAGLEEAKIEIQEIVSFLKNPSFYTRLGAKIPKGVILVGPPGTGKTLLAKAVAGEAKVPFFHISGSEFVEMFVGVGASRVRDLFKKAKAKALVLSL